MLLSRQGTLRWARILCVRRGGERTFESLHQPNRPKFRIRKFNKRDKDDPPYDASQYTPTAASALSVYEELFSQDEKSLERKSDASQEPRSWSAQQHQSEVIETGSNDRLPRLDPPFFEKSVELRPGSVLGQEAASNAFRLESPSLLVLTCASLSLQADDFSSIAPKGAHIKDWSGPGSIIKVFPVRDAQTLIQSASYFILFSNPANARVYQNHVLQLQLLAQKYMPTSIASPPVPGAVSTITGTPSSLKHANTDLRSLIYSYTLTPPAQRLTLKILPGPYRGHLKTLVQSQGYPAITRAGTTGTEDRTGRAVLFSIDGPASWQPRLVELRAEIRNDGIKRGLAWSVQTIEELGDASQWQKGIAGTGKSRSAANEIARVDDSAPLHSGLANEGGEEAAEEDAADKRRSVATIRRHMIVFANSDEAYRFRRAWVGRIWRRRARRKRESRRNDEDLEDDDADEFESEGGKVIADILW